MTQSEFTYGKPTADNSDVKAVWEYLLTSEGATAEQIVKAAKKLGHSKCHPATVELEIRDELEPLSLTIKGNDHNTGPVRGVLMPMRKE